MPYAPLPAAERAEIRRELYRGDIFWPWREWPQRRREFFLRPNKSKMDTKSQFVFFWRNGLEPDIAMRLAIAWGSQITAWELKDTVRKAREDPDGLMSVSPNIWRFIYDEGEDPTPYAPTRTQNPPQTGSPTKSKPFGRSDNEPNPLKTYRTPPVLKTKTSLRKGSGFKYKPKPPKRYLFQSPYKKQRKSGPY